MIIAQHKFDYTPCNFFYEYYFVFIIILLFFHRYKLNYYFLFYFFKKNCTKHFSSLLFILFFTGKVSHKKKLQFFSQAIIQAVSVSYTFDFITYFPKGFKIFMSRETIFLKCKYALTGKHTQYLIAFNASKTNIFSFLFILYYKMALNV